MNREMNRRRLTFTGVLAATLVAFATACGTDVETVPAPSAPTATVDGHEVTLSWTGSGDEYHVERQVSGAEFSEVGHSEETSLSTGMFQRARTPTGWSRAGTGWSRTPPTLPW